MTESPSVRLSAVLVAMLVLGLDQLSKQWAIAVLHQPGGTWALPGPIDLTLVFNRSNAFGLAPGQGELTRWGLTVLNVAAVVILTWIVVRRKLSPLNAFGLAFVIAGAAGNALDRIQFGAVVDFVNAGKIGFVWVFNLADVSLDLGIGLMLLARLLGRRRSDTGESRRITPRFK